MNSAGFDSNILAYLAGVRRDPKDDAKIVRARLVLDKLAEEVRLVAPVQALGETFVVLRRHGVALDDAAQRIAGLTASFQLAPSISSTLESALTFASEHRLQFWDSLIIAASLEAGCRLLLSEDMQDGFTVRGLTVVNPLLDKPHRALVRLLEA